MRQESSFKCLDNTTAASSPLTETSFGFLMSMQFDQGKMDFWYGMIRCPYLDYVL